MAFVPKLTDRAPALVVSTIFLYVVSLMMFGLRVYVRASRGVWGMDDTLMAIAMVSYASVAIVIVLGAYSGFGMHAQNFTAGSTNAYQYLFAFQMTFLLSSIPFKCSIIASLYRIAPQRIYKVILWAMTFITVVGYLVTLFYVLFWCWPISYRWNPVGKGSCGSTESILKLSYAITAIAIFIDWTCVFIPIPLLWGVQMSIRTKLIVLFLLCLGGVASISTIVRIKGLSAYVDVEDYLYGVFNIVFWSMLETGLGTIAASLATLRPLFRRFLTNGTAASSNPKPYNPYGNSISRRLQRPKPDAYQIYSTDEEEVSYENGGFGTDGKLGGMEMETRITHGRKQGADGSAGADDESDGICVRHNFEVSSIKGLVKN